MSLILKNNSEEEIKIIYDKECPFCSNYIQFLKLKQKIKSVILINARINQEYVLEMMRLKMDINQGMLVIYQNKLYFGHNAMNIISEISDNKNIFVNFINFFFRIKKFSRFFYFFCKMARNLALFILGKKKI